MQPSKINIHRTSTTSVMKTYEIYPIMYFEEKKKNDGVFHAKKNSKKKHVFPKQNLEKTPALKQKDPIMVSATK